LEKHNPDLTGRKAKNLDPTSTGRDRSAGEEVFLGQTKRKKREKETKPRNQEISQEHRGENLMSPARKTVDQWRKRKPVANGEKSKKGQRIST